MKERSRTKSGARVGSTVILQRVVRLARMRRRATNRWLPIPVGSIAGKGPNPPARCNLHVLALLHTRRCRQLVWETLTVRRPLGSRDRRARHDRPAAPGLSPPLENRTPFRQRVPDYRRLLFQVKRLSPRRAEHRTACEIADSVTIATEIVASQVPSVPASANSCRSELSDSSLSEGVGAITGEPPCHRDHAIR